MSRWFFLLFCVFSTAAAAAEAPPAHPAKHITYSAEQFVGLLDDAELKYYNETFSYTMDHAKPAEATSWKTYGAHGTLTPDGSFAGNGTVCRNFHEVVTVKNLHESTFDGTACKRVGDEGWCKLRRADALNCALEPPRSLTDRVQRDANDSVNNATNKVTNWLPF